MIKRIVIWIKKIKYYWSREHCYDQREYEGYAAMGSCGGLAGGDSSSGYLQFSCIECPHFVDLTK
jgi:hypothetical protein